ncbi:MAG: hypothetical protein WBA57_00790 [Elainellaceae cyanobacterium]
MDPQLPFAEYHPLVAVARSEDSLKVKPEYRLSKFQQALPEQFALEMVQDYLLDIPAAVTFLQVS